MNQHTGSIHMIDKNLSHASTFFTQYLEPKSYLINPYIFLCTSTSSVYLCASIFLTEKTLIERTTCKVSDWSSLDRPSWLLFVFHQILLFIFSLSFSFLFSFFVRDVASLCGSVRFFEELYNFRNSITQRYGSFPFFFVYGLLRNC